MKSATAEDTYARTFAQPRDPCRDILQTRLQFDPELPEQEHAGYEGDIGKRKIPDQEFLAVERRFQASQHADDLALVLANPLGVPLALRLVQLGQDHTGRRGERIVSKIFQ